MQHSVITFVIDRSVVFYGYSNFLHHMTEILVKVELKAIDKSKQSFRMAVIEDNHNN